MGWGFAPATPSGVAEPVEEEEEEREFRVQIRENGIKYKVHRGYIGIIFLELLPITSNQESLQKSGFGKRAGLGVDGTIAC